MLYEVITPAKAAQEMAKNAMKAKFFFWFRENLDIYKVVLLEFNVLSINTFPILAA